MSTGEKDAAFDRVYAELFRDVFSYFNVCFGAEAAEDLAQEVFLRVWKTLDGGKIPDSWRAWVFRCAVNLKNDFLRQKYAGKKQILRRAISARTKRRRRKQRGAYRHTAGACPSA